MVEVEQASTEYIRGRCVLVEEAERLRRASGAARRMEEAAVLHVR